MSKLGVAVLAVGLAFAGCSSSQPSARALAETCNIFKSHYDTQQIESAAISGQKSGDSDLARDAAHLQTDLKKQYDDTSVVIDVQNMNERCVQLGAIPKCDLDANC